MALPVWLIIFLAVLSAGALSADFESDCAAFERGDYEEAREAWAPLAEQGHAQAQFRLGCLYAFGQGVPEDYAMALRLYRLAAEQGDADAQNNLGGMYAEGLGVQPDRVQAYKWFEIAATTGHAVAISNRAYVAERMTADQIAEAEAMAREWRAGR
jgi:uncharacterized protein